MDGLLATTGSGLDVAALAGVAGAEVDTDAVVVCGVTAVGGVFGF